MTETVLDLVAAGFPPRLIAAFVTLRARYQATRDGAPGTRGAFARYLVATGRLNEGGPERTWRRDLARELAEWI